MFIHNLINIVSHQRIENISAGNEEIKRCVMGIFSLPYKEIDDGKNIHKTI
jgi:hypothetical protein